MIYYDYEKDQLMDSDYYSPENHGYPPSLDGTTEDDKWPATIEKDLGWQREQKENQDE